MEKAIIQTLTCEELYLKKKSKKEKENSSVMKGWKKIPQHTENLLSTAVNKSEIPKDLKLEHVIKLIQSEKRSGSLNNNV